MACPLERSFRFLETSMDFLWGILNTSIWPILTSRERTFYKYLDSQGMRRKERIRDRPASVDAEISSQFWLSKKDAIISKYVKLRCQINYTYAPLRRHVLICQRTANKKDSPQLSPPSAPHLYRWTRESTT